MRVISKLKLSAFWDKHPISKAALASWYEEATQAKWKSPQDIKQRFASASFLSGNRVVFNVKGNEYRLVVAVAYKLGAIYIKFVGTHAEYDAIDAISVEPKR